MRAFLRLPHHSEPLSAASLCSAANIDAEARGLATRGLPRTDEAGQAASELTVLEIVNERINRRHSELDEAEHQITGELAALPEAEASVATERLVANVTQGLSQVLHTSSDVVSAVVTAERTGRAEFNAYRQRHGLLERSARYPQSIIRALALVLVIILFEAFANTAMYVSAVKGGYLAAFMTALVVAGINVGMAFGVGLVARYLSYHDLPPEQPYRRRNTRLWVIPVLLVAVAGVVGVNLFAAHYREVAMASRDQFREAQVLGHLLQTPLELSLAAYGLLVAGVLCAIAAAWKGYTVSDPYPGYAREHRRYQDKLDDRNDLKVALHGHLDAIRLTHIDGPFHVSTARRAALEHIQGQYHALTIAVSRAARLDDGDLAAASASLARFRRINLGIRTDGVKPKYFNAPTDFSALKPERSIEELGRMIEDALAQHSAASAQLLEALAEQRARIDRAKDEIDRVIPAIGDHDVTERALPSVAEILRAIDLNSDGRSIGLAGGA